METLQIYALFDALGSLRKSPMEGTLPIGQERQSVLKPTINNQPYLIQKRTKTTFRQIRIERCYCSQLAAKFKFH